MSSPSRRINLHIVALRKFRPPVAGQGQSRPRPRLRPVPTPHCAPDADSRKP